MRKETIWTSSNHSIAGTVHAEAPLSHRIRLLPRKWACFHNEFGVRRNVTFAARDVSPDIPMLSEITTMHSANCCVLERVVGNMDPKQKLPPVKPRSFRCMSYWKTRELDHTVRLRRYDVEIR